MNALTDFFLPYQIRWINDNSPMKLYPKSRRVGITYATSYRSVIKCLERENFTQWVTSRDLLTAKEFITDYVAKWAKSANVAARDLLGENVQVVDPLHGITAFVVNFNNRSRIISLSSTPEAFAGKGGDVIVDEADLHDDSGKVIDMSLPCTTWGGQLEVLSALKVDGGPNTPFCKLVEDAAKNGNPMGWSLHRTSILDAVNEGFVEKLNEVLGTNYSRDEWLAQMRGKCRSEEAWKSQYLIIPADDNGALLTYELITGCEVPANELPGLNDTDPLYVGMDIGRVHDLSIIWGKQRKGDVLWTAFIDTMFNTQFRVQLDKLSMRLDHPKLVRCCIDSTGIGAMLAEEAQHRFGSYTVEPIQFTNNVKADLAMPMLRRFQDRTIRIPSNPEIREDLHKISKTTTSSGNIRFEADRDSSGHADRFWALALAIHAAGQKNSNAFAF